MSSSTQPMKVGDFLLRRLEEAGARHLFGPPGDYNLALLQQLQDAGALKWIGTCNELKAPESTRESPTRSVFVWLRQSLAIGRES